MRFNRFNKFAFILMGIILIEIVAMVQAIFCQQVIKYNVEQQLEQSSEMLLTQFMNSYEVNSHFQNNLIDLSYEHFDKGLVELYTHIVQSLEMNSEQVASNKITNENGEYEIEIMAHTPANDNLFMDQFGVNIDKLQQFKIISYQMKQSDELLLERRILIGQSLDQKKIITIEVELKALQEKIRKSNEAMSTLLSDAYRSRENMGSFYVLSGDGRVLYQGAALSDAQNFNSVDLNTNKSINEIIRRETNFYQHIIYEKNEEIKRSMLRVKYEKVNNLYFVHECDQKKAFVQIENRMLMTWIFGLTLIVLTLLVLVFLRVYFKKSPEE